MAILRSLDGRYYEIPDDQAEKFLIPEDKLKEKLQSAPPPAGESGPPPGSGASGPPPILVQIYGVGPGGAGTPPPGGAGAPAPAGAEVSPYDHHWHNHWQNYWQNWYNVWHNWHRRD
jgi:hypothetical protein